MHRSLKLTRKQAKLVEGIVAGKSGAAAARDAGYAEKTPGTAAQAGHQALKALEERVRDAMDRHGHTLDELIEKHLDPIPRGEGNEILPLAQVGKGQARASHRSA